MLDMSNTTNLLQNLKADKQSADNHKSTWDGRREVWIKESNGEPYGNEDKSGKKATIVSRDIKKTEVWQHATIIDPFVSNSDMVRTSPISANDKPLADQREKVLNYFFCHSFDRYNFVSEAFKILQREGTVIARVGWEFAEEEVEAQVPVTQIVNIPGPQGITQQEQVIGYRTEMQMQTVLNRPTAENRDNKTLWVDPTEKQNISNAQFVIEHFKSSISKLTQEGIYENLEDINTKDDNWDDEDNTYDDSSDESFKFTDKARAEIDVYEYWGNYDIDGDGIAEPIVCTWVGDVIIRLEENPYPDGEVPYISTALDPEPFSINGRPNADLQSTDQKMNTSILRSIMDTLDSSTNGQRGFKEGTLDPANERKFNARENFKYQGNATDIWEGKYADINPSVIDFYQMTKQNQSELTGVRPFAGGEGQYESAQSSKMAMGAVAKREVDLSRNFAENFIIPLLRKWSSMISIFMEPQEIERITGKPYVQPQNDNPDGDMDIRIEVNTAETDAAKASDISFMLQTMAQSLPFDLTKILLAEQAELKKMPSLATKIMEYQPQPDPMEQKRKELELKKLESEIAERVSRTQENQVEIRLKEAKAVNEEAKARQGHAKADLDDQAFVDNSTGVTHQRDLEKQGQKIRGDLAKQSMSKSGGQ